MRNHNVKHIIEDIIGGLCLFGSFYLGLWAIAAFQ